MLKLFKSSSLYGAFANQLYDADVGLSQLPFSAQRQYLLNQGFCFGDSWKHYLEQTGDYQVSEHLSSVEPLQRRWASEQGISVSDEGWQLEVLFAQLCKAKPDIWFSHALVPSSFRLKVRERIPSIRLVIGYDGHWAHDPSIYQGCDLMLTCVQETAAFYRAKGFSSFYWPHGFDERILTRFSTQSRDVKCAFAGSVLLAGSMKHIQRLSFLAEISKSCELFPAVYISPSNHVGFFRACCSNVKSGAVIEGLRLLRNYSRWRYMVSIAKRPVYGLDMFKLLGSSKIAVNLHGDVVTTAANKRLFETTGVGACLVTDWHPNISEFFEPEEEVVTYRSVEECKQKILMLQKDANRMQIIAAAGQKRCLRDHSSRSRLDLIDALIKTTLA